MTNLILNSYLFTKEGEKERMLLSERAISSGMIRRFFRLNPDLEPCPNQFAHFKVGIERHIEFFRKNPAPRSDYMHLVTKESSP